MKEDFEISEISYTFVSMQELISYIEKLLLTHECVIIPDLGGFVVYERPATIQNEEHLLLPPSKEIRFNEDLKHNDGLIAEMYMKSHAVDYDTACVMIQKDVAIINTKLTEKREVRIGKIGKLFLNERSNLQFSFATSEFILPKYYGLSSFRCMELRHLQQQYVVSKEKEEEKDNMIHIRINRSFFRYAISSVAIAIILLMISTPIQSPQTDYASILLSVQSAKTNMNIPAEIKNEELSENVIPENNTNIITSDTLIDAQVETQIQTATVATEKEESTTAYNGRTYYIVVGSVQTAQQAEKIIEKQKAKGFEQTSYIEKDEKIRIYVQSFREKHLAEEYVIQFREQYPEHADAWVFSAR